MFFVKTGMLSLIRNIPLDHTQETKACQICVSKLSSGDVFGEATILDEKQMTVFTTSVISETLSICYRLDKLQLERSHWDSDTKRNLSATSIKFQDDSTLLRLLSEQSKFKMKSELIVRKVQNLITKKHTNKQLRR